MMAIDHTLDDSNIAPLFQTSLSWTPHMSVEATLPSIFDVAPLETGGVEARAGLVFQDHVAARYCLLMLESDDLKQVWCEAQDDITLIREDSSDVLVEFV